MDEASNASVDEKFRAITEREKRIACCSDAASASTQSLTSLLDRNTATRDAVHLTSTRAPQSSCASDAHCIGLQMLHDNSEHRGVRECRRFRRWSCDMLESSERHR